ncbi:MAG: CoA-binding protein [Cyclobacteriaceae bacterium]|nr:MAG: CoA-binding protein [Cyclobacteriaceae bacterium]
MKTVIIGATPNPSRYAYLAAEMLTEYDHEFVPVGIKKGELFGKEILDIRTKPPVADVDTVTMYIGPQHQPEWYEYIIGLKPRRIIFNPGTENYEFETLARENKIEPIEACTLVMLRTGQY